MTEMERLRRVGPGGAPLLCQRALSELLRNLFAGKTYRSTTGQRGVTVYLQELPIQNQDDADADGEDAPTPFLIVRQEAGAIRGEDSPQEIDMSILLCAYGDDLERTGWMDVSNMRERIIRELCERPRFGGAYTVEVPSIKWENQQDDTHPYYYGVITVKCTAPALSQDAALAGLI